MFPAALVWAICKPNTMVDFVKPRKICIVTGTRADYGLLFWLIKAVNEDPNLVLQLIITGTHFSKLYGSTYRQIESDGFRNYTRVEMLAEDDSKTSVAKSIGSAVIGFSDALKHLSPDILVVLGDRYEILAAAQTAVIYGIPVAHIHGGEVTEGAIDERIRHAVTKLSDIHFAASDAFATRIMQMGEQPDHVHIVGAPGLEYFERLDVVSRHEIEDYLGLSLEGIIFLVTYHPLTVDEETSIQGVEALLTVLDQFDDVRIIFTGVNADPGSSGIAMRLHGYARQNTDHVSMVASLGQRRYLSLLQLVDVVIGNSSSGIIEAPAVGTPTVNIGDRQKGRPQAASIVNCIETVTSIRDAISKVLEPKFHETVNDSLRPYCGGHVAENIKSVLKNTSLGMLKRKEFHEYP